MDGYPDNTARDKEIRKLWKQGLSQREIAQRFDRSRGRIQQIIRGDPRKKERQQRRAVCLEAMIRLQNDLDMQWSCEILVPILGLSGWAKKRMSEHFRKRRRKSISLRKLMDLVLPYRFRDYFTDIPLLQKPGIGHCIHRSVLAAISACDFGPAFTAEWQARMDYSQNYWENLLLASRKPSCRIC